MSSAVSQKVAIKLNKACIKLADDQQKFNLNAPVLKLKIASTTKNVSTLHLGVNTDQASRIRQPVSEFILP